MWKVLIHFSETLMGINVVKVFEFNNEDSAIIAKEWFHVRGFDTVMFKDPP